MLEHDRTDGRGALLLEETKPQNADHDRRIISCIITHGHLACDLRPEWRIYVLVLLVDQCWASKANLQQLHVLDWAIRTRETQEAFLQFLAGERAPNQIIVRYDPSLNRAVDFAFGEGLLTNREEEQSSLLPDDSKKTKGSYRISLASKGRTLVRQLKEEKALMVAEKDFLAKLRRKLTQKQVEVLFDWGMQ